MPTIQKAKAESPVLADKQALADLVREIDGRVGAVSDSPPSIEELRALHRELGIRPEDNIGSRELMRMRYPRGPRVAGVGFRSR